MAIGNYDEASIRESFLAIARDSNEISRGARGFLGKVEATFARSKGSRKFPMR